MARCAEDVDEVSNSVKADQVNVIKLFNNDSILIT